MCKGPGLEGARTVLGVSKAAALQKAHWTWAKPGTCGEVRIKRVHRAIQWVQKSPETHTTCCGSASSLVAFRPRPAPGQDMDESRKRQERILAEATALVATVTPGAGSMSRDLCRR